MQRGPSLKRKNASGSRMVPVDAVGSIVLITQLSSPRRKVSMPMRTITITAKAVVSVPMNAPQIASTWRRSEIQ